jgi:ligand-binding sensor domain-containing protein
VWSVQERSKGGVWIGTQEDLFLHDDIGLHRFPHGSNANQAALALADDGSHLWVGRHEGLEQFSGGKFVAHDLPARPLHDSVVTLFKDREGSVWAGTILGSGLYRLLNGKIARVDTGSGLSCARVRAIHTARRGGLWFGTRGSALSLYQHGEFTRIGKDALPDSVTALHEDNDGILWIGTNRGSQPARGGHRHELRP